MKKTKRVLLFFAIVWTSLEGAHANDTYKIDPARSTVSFGVHHFVGVTKGKFTQCTGTIEIDREHPERSIVVAQIQVKSIDTGIRKRDEHLSSTEFFDAAKYPQITFKSGRVRQSGQQAGDISGDLTMHGVTRPILLHVKLLTPMRGEEPLSHPRWAVTTEPLKRRDFNLLFGRSAEALSGIGQEVTVNLEIEATKAP